MEILRSNKSLKTIGSTLRACLLIALVGQAYAADTICGVDTDEDGTYSVLCTGIGDADRDGIVTASDCDDSNRYIVPGSFKDDSGTLKLCESDGTWTSVGAWPSGVDAGKANADCGSVKFVDPSGSTSDNTCGAHNNPCDYRCFSSSNGLGCSQTLSAGACVFFLTGNYTGYYTSIERRQIYLNNIDGTSGNEIKFIGVVGQAATITGQGTGANPGDIVNFENSNYVWVQGLEITGGTGGYAVHLQGGTNNRVFANHIHDYENYRNDNHAGVVARAAADNARIERNVIHDITYASSPTSEHNNQILLMDADSYTVDYNVAYCPSCGRGIIDKHAMGGSTEKSIRGNVVYGVNGYGIIAASRHVTVKNNFVQGVGNACFQVIDVGGGADEYGDIVFRENTCDDSWPIEIVPDANAQAGDTYAVEVINNIFSDDRGSAYSGDGSAGFIRLCHYCSDALYTSYITGNKLHFDNNGLYNTAAVALFESVWGDGAGSGTTYTNCSNITVGTPAHTNTPCSGNAGTDPGLDSEYIATTVGLTDAGWNVDWPTTTTIAPTSKGGRHRAIRERRR